MFKHEKNNIKKDVAKKNINNKSHNKANKKRISVKKILKNIIDFLKRYWKILLILICIALVIIISIFVYNYLYDKKYKVYEQKMENYGFNLMYNNQSDKSHEKVTNSEAIKMILSSLYNVYNTKTFMPESDKLEYTNQQWIQYAISIGIITNDNINEKNQNKYIKYKDAIKYYMIARNKILDKTTKYDKEAKFKDLKKYSSDMQQYINDAAENSLINNTETKLNANKYMTKGQFNMLIIKMVEKYNTITVGDDKININPDKIPSNYYQYPYTLSNVDKSVYEIPFKYTKDIPIDTPQNPITTYINKKEYYMQIEEISQDYFNYILNIDYQTLDKDNFFNTILNNYSLNPISDSDIDNYINYIKANKIKITGKATAQLPVIYFDGDSYRIRMKLDFKVESSDKMTNVLLGDLINNEQDTKYLNNNSIIVDAKIGMTANSKTMFINIVPTYEIVVKY